MLKFLGFLFAVQFVTQAYALELTGAGSSAAAPLYVKWQAAFAKKTNDQFTYQSIGSSAGIQKLKERLADFGASDAPMSAADLKKFDLIDFPTVISGVVPFVTIPGVHPGELRLSAGTLSGIYSGTITRWNDPAIIADNPTLTLPALVIVPIARADGSGTTFTLTDYLSRVSPLWEKTYGTHFSIKWDGAVVAVKGTAELVAAVKKTVGAIGYAEYAYILENNLSYVMMKNRDAQFVRPNAASFTAALAKSGWKKTGNFEEMLTDKPGASSWPITGATYVYMHRVAQQPERTAAVMQFFTWAFMEGDNIANGLDFVRLPDTVQGRVFHEMSRVVDLHGNALPIPIAIR